MQPLKNPTSKYFAKNLPKGLFERLLPLPKKRPHLSPEEWVLSSPGVQLIARFLPLGDNQCSPSMALGIRVSKKLGNAPLRSSLRRVVRDTSRNAFGTAPQQRAEILIRLLPHPKAQVSGRSYRTNADNIAQQTAFYREQLHLVWGNFFKKLSPL